MLASDEAREHVWSVVLDNAFTLTILLSFAIVVVLTLVRRYRRDKCLALLDDFHVTFADADGRARWGDLVVVPGGIEVRFDAPLFESSCLPKGSALIYEEELLAGVGLCRSVDALTPAERVLRRAQLRRRVRPSPARVVLRALANLAAALRDAMAQTLRVAVDGMVASVPIPAEHADDSDGAEPTSARTYEPLLERWIGRPVVVRLWAADPEYPVELPGYLVEYTADHLVVFNLEREVRGELELEVSGDLQGDGFFIEWKPPWVRIHCTGPEVLVVESITTELGTMPIDCALLRGTFAELRSPSREPCTIRLHRTQRVDVVCPRSRAVVTHGGELDLDATMTGTADHGPCTELRAAD